VSEGTVVGIKNGWIIVFADVSSQAPGRCRRQQS
jgi:hypothetical protein